MAGGAYVILRQLYDALLIDDECGADKSFVDFAVVFLFAPCTVGECDGVIGIGEKGEGERLFGGELL